ncbi:MAG: hypothetical protein QOI61_998, partial [Actinomycetota bacterium]
MGSGATTTVHCGTAPTQSETDKAREWRKSFFLDSSDAAIEAAAKNPAPDYDRYGSVRLTTAELAELDRTQDNVEATRSLRQIVHDHPAEYGQPWVDNEHGGIFVIQIAPGGSEQPVRDLMAQNNIDPKLVRFETVEHSQAELSAQQDAFWRDEVPKLRQRGLVVQSGGAGNK